MKRHLVAAFAMAASALFADVYIVNGERIEGEVHEFDGQRTICTETMCIMLPDDAVKVEDGPRPAADAAPAAAGGDARREGAAERVRIREGLMDAREFLAFLSGGDGASSPESSLAGKSWWLVLVLVVFGGLCMNLTPCVLPMVPVNLMVIGKSALRGALYGLGIAVAYGIMGVLAALGGMAFGEIQGNPWFNAAIAALFVVLALSLSGVFFIDLSGARGGFATKRRSMIPGLFAFAMGAVSAVLAGACVAPILIAVLLLTADLAAQGCRAALLLPFAMGVGMALPWPFAGAGMKILPRPGTWMKKVNVAFGAVVLGFAAWYGYLAWKGFAARSGAEASAVVSGSAADAAVPLGARVDATPATFRSVLARAERPVLVDCWATWCKNCAAMEKTTLADPAVAAALGRFSVVRLQAEDMKELKALEGFSGVRGLPAFMVVE